MEPELHGLGDELLKKFEMAEQSLLTVSSMPQLQCLQVRPPLSNSNSFAVPLVASVSQVMKHSRLLSSSSTAFLQQKLQLRAPYVAPLNILQVAVRVWVVGAGCFHEMRPRLSLELLADIGCNGCGGAAVLLLSYTQLPPWCR